MKATAIAPSNIAFIKYWGKTNEELRLPSNGSISMNLSNLLTTTTVEFDAQFQRDDILINNKQDVLKENRVIKHLDRIRKHANISYKAKVRSKNNFPSSTGLSSSASAFASLSVAGTKAVGLTLSKKELSILARLGSGSACRSIPDGFVEWLKGKNNNTSYAVSIFPSNHWKIVDIVAIVSIGSKEISSSQGQKYATSSPFYSTRLLRMKDKIKMMKKILQDRDFTAFGELLEEEALEMHAIMLTSRPSLIYWTLGTLKIIKQAKNWRQQGLPVYFTVNTGQDIHLFCQKENEGTLVAELKKLTEVRNIIINYPAVGARLTNKHLF